MSTEPRSAEFFIIVIGFYSISLDSLLAMGPAPSTAGLAPRWLPEPGTALLAASLALCRIHPEALALSQSTGTSGCSPWGPAWLRAPLATRRGFADALLKGRCLRPCPGRAPDVDTTTAPVRTFLTSGSFCI